MDKKLKINLPYRIVWYTNISLNKSKILRNGNLLLYDKLINGKILVEIYSHVLCSNDRDPSLKHLRFTMRSIITNYQNNQQSNSYSEMLIPNQTSSKMLYETFSKPSHFI